MLTLRTSGSVGDAVLAGWRVGIDIGGTFTDIIAVRDEAGIRRSGKVPSVPAEPVRAIIDALAALDIDWQDVDEIVHGTTIVTNDIVEQRLRPCALVTTRGFGDTIELGRGSRRHLYSLAKPPKPPALVPPELRFELDERVGHDGTVLRAPDAEELDRLAAAIRATGIDTVAVCLLHGFRNPHHERLVGERLGGFIPNLCLSHEISPEAREFERMNTTVLNAMMMDKIRRHLDRIDEHKPQGSRLHMMHSASGMSSPEVIAERPLMLAMSGPAAGVTATSQVARSVGIRNALTFDMGGTTTDICVIVDGKTEISTNRELGGRRIRFPMVAVDSIGAGGGSIARLSSGALLVGPESAGASPGPACYDRGGVLPTTSDADYLLGYLNPDRTLGTTVRMSRDRAEAAIDTIAEAMGFTREDAALGINRVIHANMARALRKATVERGVDIREFDLVAFGGAGPMHAAEVARQCGIARVLIPAFSSGFSALGCVDAVMRYSRQQTVGIRSGDWQQAAVDAVVVEQIADLSTRLVRAGHDRATLTVEHVAGIRYSGQSYELPIAAPRLDDADTLGAQFEETHLRLYGYATQEPWELVSIRTEVSAAPSDVPPYRPSPPTRTLAPVDRRDVVFEEAGRLSTPVFERGALPCGVAIVGPAIIEDEWSTIVVPPRDRARADEGGNILLDVELR